MALVQIFLVQCTAKNDEHSLYLSNIFFLIVQIDIIFVRSSFTTIKVSSVNALLVILSGLDQTFLDLHRELSRILVPTATCVLPLRVVHIAQVVQGPRLTNLVTEMT